MSWGSIFTREYRGHQFRIIFGEVAFGFITDFEKDIKGLEVELHTRDFHWVESIDKAIAEAKKEIDAELLAESIDQSIHDDKDDGQYDILYEGFHSGHRYMIAKDQQYSYNNIGYATDFSQDLSGLAPDFCRFYYGSNTEEQAIKLARQSIDLKIKKQPKFVQEVSMGVQEEKEVIEAKRVMSWAIIKLTKSIEDLRELCKRKDWDNEVTYYMEEAKTKLGECLADLTVWDEESFEMGSTHA